MRPKDSPRLCRWNVKRKRKREGEKERRREGEKDDFFGSTLN